jgi:hypothetical protein
MEDVRGLPGTFRVVGQVIRMQRPNKRLQLTGLRVPEIW